MLRIIKRYNKSSNDNNNNNTFSLVIIIYKKKKSIISLTFSNVTRFSKILLLNGIRICMNTRICGLHIVSGTSFCHI